ncbi:MAG: sodium:proton antiporter, partial [Bacteroidaceae bacterium]|nr:sodium:proton antiporter [Bacteroidaceae bacterium]
MIPVIVTIFVLGYTCIALEHKLKVNKAATALVMFGLIWTIYALHSGDVTSSLMEHLGSTCETLVFLIGAMTIVEIIDIYGGFNVITRYV